jgi:hypothetical protein
VTRASPAKSICPQCGAIFVEVGPDGRRCSAGHWLPRDPSLSPLSQLPPEHRNGVKGDSNGTAAHEKLVGPTAVSVRLSAVVPEVVRWLWAGRFPLGKLALVDGDPGLGKSTMLLDIAARVSRGDAMPDGSHGDVVGAGGVVILQAEDGLADTIVPRLLAAGADLDRIEAFTFMAEPAETDHEGRTRKPAHDRLPHLADVQGLADVIARIEARLVIVDPLVAFLPPRIDSNKDSEVRQGLSGVVGLAGVSGCCVVGVRHLNKASALSALYRGGGSIGIIGAARSGLLVASDPDSPARRVLAPLKSNLAPIAPSLAWHLEASAGGVAHVVWEGVTELSATALLEGGDKEDGRSCPKASGPPKS